MSDGQATATLLDCELRFFGPSFDSTYRYAATYAVGVLTVRIRLRVDRYRHQSYAIAEVLSEDFHWTTLMDAEPPPKIKPGASDVAESAERFATGLLKRARGILTTSQEAGNR